MKRVLLLGAALCGPVLVSVSVTPAAAEPQQDPRNGVATTAIEGRIVAVEGEDVIIDLAGGEEMSVGSVVEIWRPISLRHPVTRRMLTDRFRIGALRLTQVRNVVSFGRTEGELLREPRAGDIVVAYRRARAEPQKQAAPANESKRANTVPAAEGAAPVVQDVSAREVTELFESLHGATVAQRIRAYEAYAAAHPGAPLSTTLSEEASALRRLFSRRESGEAGPAEPGSKAFEPARTVLAGIPLTIAVDVEGGAPGAVLHSRNAGEVTYVSTPMKAVGPGYFSATIPANRIVAPRVEYFIEATTESGEAVAIVGTAETPNRTRVQTIPKPAAPLHHDTSITALTDYADYNRLRGNDRVWQTEGTIAVRFQDEGVRAMRTGFGVYRGVGGSIEELDVLDREPRRVGLTYGHLEGEFAFQHALSLIARGVLGLGDEGTAIGAQIHLRIGNDLETNLSIGGEALGGIGLRGITQLELSPQSRFPILLRSEVTNQPVGSGVDGGEPSLNPPPTTAVERSEVGIRAIAQFGYRVIPPLVVAIRGSYQGRTINHAGPGLGGAVTYSW